MRHIILPGLTTTPKSDWRGKTREIDRLGLKEVALFPTFLEIEDRKELYSLLEKTNLQKIPHVHLRDDMEEWELDLFTNKYKTEVFNIHPEPTELGFLKNLKRVDNVYAENLNKITDLYFEIADMCGGVCLDVSHWEDYGIPEGYENFSEKIKKYKIGCSHVSAIKKDFQVWEHYITKEKLNFYSAHYMDELSELDYVKKYVQYLPEYVSIELENSFEEQLKIKEYLEKIINGQ